MCRAALSSAIEPSAPSAGERQLMTINEYRCQHSISKEQTRNNNTNNISCLINTNIEIIKNIQGLWLLKLYTTK